MIATRLRPVTIERDGQRLEYYRSDTGGTPVVIVNAIGQPLDYWYPFLERTSTFPVIIWRLRGLRHAPQPVTMADHLRDLEAIVDAEQPTRIHLLGWCTGGKTAIEYCLRRPDSVESLTLLNCSFTAGGQCEARDTDYSRHLMVVCRMLRDRPGSVGAVMKVLRNASTDDVAERASVRAWASEAFEDEETTLNYARQMVSFWSSDPRSKASQVKVPVLVVASSQDRVVSCDIARSVASRFPDARYVELKDTSHYCMYERSAEVADMLASFLANPGDFAPHLGDVTIDL